MVQLQDLPPNTSDLFSAFDHVVRAMQKGEHGRERHLEWAQYHLKRFRNLNGSYRSDAGLSPHSEEELETWRTLEQMLLQLSEEPIE